MGNGISILICTHNSSKLIEKTLSYLLKQKVHSSIPWEIVLVDNACTDGTAQIAKSFWKSDVPFKIISEPKPGVAYARVTGMNACQYAYIAFIDDDNWVEENWVETAFHAMQSHPDVSAIGGPSEAVFESRAPEWFARYSQNYAVGEQYHKAGEITELNKLLWGAGLVLRKDAWDYLYEHGYEPIHEARKGKNLYSGEESEILILFKLMGSALFYNPELKIKHFMTTRRLDWKYYLRLKKSFGASSIYLDMYKNIFSRITNEEQKNSTRWQKELRKSFIAVVKDPLALLAGMLNIKQGNYRIAKAYFNLGRFIQKFNMGKEYDILQDFLYNKYAPLYLAWKTINSSQTN